MCVGGERAQVRDARKDIEGRGEVRDEQWKCLDIL